MTEFVVIYALVCGILIGTLMGFCFGRLYSLSLNPPIPTTAEKPRKDA